MRRVLSIAAAGLVLTCASIAYAQTNLFSDYSGGSALIISMSPQDPVPGESVTLTLSDAVSDLSQSSITWVENGATIAAGTGETSVTVTAPALGQSANISVSAVDSDGSSDSTQISVSPTEVDLLADSDSYVPPFYRGRALPGAQTDLRLEAIAHFIRADGSAVPSSQITYTWKQDGRVVGNVSGTGRSTAVLPADLLFGSTQIEVDAASTDGAFSGSASIALPTIDPVVALYEDNPVYGFTYYHALGATQQMSEVEMTFAAVPYFAQAQSPNDAHLSYAWTVNGSSVSPSPADPSEITLNAQNSSGKADVGLTLTSAQNAYIDSQGAWTVALGATQSSDVFDTAAPPSNPFTGTQ